MLPFNKIEEIVENERERQVLHHPSRECDINSLASTFHLKLGSHEINTVSDIFDMCRFADRELKLGRLEEPLRSIISVSRNAIRDGLIEAFYSEKRRGLDFNDSEGLIAMDRQRELAKEVSSLLPIIRQKMSVEDHEKLTFNQQWIQLEGNGTYENIRRLIHDRETDTFDWEMVKEMLPSDLREKFEISKRGSLDKEIEDAAKPYRSIAEKLGPEVLYQYLVSIGQVKVGFTKGKKIISAFLGRFRTGKPNLGDVTHYPAALLKLSDVRRMLFIELRNYIYRELVKDGDDLAPEVYELKINGYKGKVEKMLRDLTDGDVDEHRQLFKEVFDYFEEVFSLKKSSRIVSYYTDKKGRKHNFPSLRQRIAMKEMETGRRKLIAFFMGKGKTATAFLSKEHVGAKKMLYVCPTNMVEEVANDLIRKYYRDKPVTVPGKKEKIPPPTVGTIRAGMTDKDLKEELKKEVVVIPYSMLKRRVVDAVKKQRFDFMAIDEIHWARKPMGTHTRMVNELVNGIPDLYEKGHIMLMSGNPTPNSPDDIAPQLAIFDRDTYGGAQSYSGLIKHKGECGRLKEVNPLIIRNAIMEFMVKVDEAEDWEKILDREGVDYGLHPAEREIYTSILENDMLDATQKLIQLPLCVLNPSAFSGGREIRSALLDATVAKLQEYFKDKDKDGNEIDAVVLAENMLKHGITREHKERICDSFVKRLRARLGDGVDIYIFDGDSAETEKQEAIEASKRKGRKTVVFAMSMTMREGTNHFSHVKRAIMLEPTYNKPDTTQFVKRFAREGNEDVKVAVMKAADSIHMGIHEHADHKYRLTQLLQENGVVDEDDQDFLKKGDLSNAIRMVDGKLFFGTAIMDHITTPRQKIMMILNYIHNRGEEELEEFFRVHGDLFAELFSENWEGSYSGNNSRFLAGLYKELEAKGIISGNTYADLGCGPLALQQTLGCAADGRKRTFYNLDLIPAMLKTGKKLLQEKKPDAQVNLKQGSVVDMKKFYGDGMFDAINCSQAIYCTKLNVQKDPPKDERVRTLLEFNRILKTGGIITMTIPTERCTEEEFAAFTQQLEKHFGFQPVKEFTGEAQSTDDTEEHHFENYTIVCRKVGNPDINGLELNKLRLSIVQRDSGNGKKKEVKPPTPNITKGHVHTSFAINKSVFEFGNEAGEAAQSEYHLMVMKARAFLAGIYETNGKTFKDLPKETEEEIDRQGIIYTSFDGTPLFRFKFSNRIEKILD